MGELVPCWYMRNCGVGCLYLENEELFESWGDPSLLTRDSLPASMLAFFTVLLTLGDGNFKRSRLLALEESSKLRSSFDWYSSRHWLSISLSNSIIFILGSFDSSLAWSIDFRSRGMILIGVENKFYLSISLSTELILPSGDISAWEGSALWPEYFDLKDVERPTWLLLSSEFPFAPFFCCVLALFSSLLSERKNGFAPIGVARISPSSMMKSLETHFFVNEEMLRLSGELSSPNSWEWGIDVFLSKTLFNH